jgi:endoglycosylceramidase
MATGIMPSPGRIDERYLDHLVVTVEQLARHHMYVLLDVHQDGWGPTDPSGAPLGSDGFPQWMTVTNGAPNTHTSFPQYYISNPAIEQAFQSLWDDASGADGFGLQEDIAKIFGALARRFGHNPWVLGYDVYNEPWPGTTWEPCLSAPDGCPGLDRHGLGLLDAKVERAIRRYDHRHLIFVEPYVLFNFGLAPTSVPLPGGDPGSGLSFHMYTASPAQEEPVLDYARAWSDRTGGALLATEWGALTDPTAITREANEMDGALMPWMYWSFDQGFVRDLREPPVGDNLDASLVAAIVRPHPLAVAGTPTTFAYDQATRTLDFAWRPGRVGRPQPGSGNVGVTSFDLPPSVYPEGYTAVVLDGRVTSPPCAPLLTIAGRSAPATASVRIVPGGGCTRGR